VIVSESTSSKAVPPGWKDHLCIQLILQIIRSGPWVRVDEIHRTRTPQEQAHSVRLSARKPPAPS
jgi:hypothetical protein